MEQTLKKVRSSDGTPIAFECSGDGPPLVVVPGVMTSSRRWPVLPMLGEHFTVYAVDRRGRGDSGDAERYTIEREFEDIAAVVDSFPAEVNVLGHSFGGLCVLGTALLTSNIRRLVIYEPPPPPDQGGWDMPTGSIDRLQALVEADDRVGVVITFLREVLSLQPEEIETAKAWPTFPFMVAAAHTLTRELRAEVSYQLDLEQFRQVQVPTLLLLGGDSPDFVKASIKSWHAVLPNSEIVVLPGQQHLAHYTAPALFVRALQTFLLDSGH